MPGEIAVTEPWLQVHPVHGEGVVWDGRTGELLFVDVPAGLVWRADTATGQATSQRVPGTVGAVHPTTDPAVLVIADSDGIALLDSSGLTRLAAPLADRPDIRMNDANVDPAGRYFAGSMAFDETPGAACLYRFDPVAGFSTVLTGVTVSNGIDWSADARRCFYIDSPLRRVDVFDYDPATGILENRRAFVDTADIPGVPDGLTVDSEDGVWVAFFGGSRVCRYTPGGRLDLTVALPVSQVTSCCFGGRDLDELYVCTSTEALSAEQLSTQPGAGAIFRATPGHRGKPGALLRLPPRH